MSSRWHLLFPLLSSLLYVGGALFVKRCAELGVGVWRTAFASNLTSALLFMPLWTLRGPGQPWSELWQPAIVALLLVVGQILGFVALSRGDVSVATPVLGVKTILVALFTTALLPQGVPLRLWLGAGLSALAVSLLHGGGGAHRRAALSAVTAVLAAICFALFDVLVQRFSPQWGVGRFLPIMNAMAAALSFGMVPLFHAPLRAVPRAAWPAVLGAAGFIAVQGLILITTVAWFGDATAVNIVYSSRGLWSVVAVWLIGHWFSSQEQHLGRRVLGWRLAGAALMTIAIVLALV
jgi:drug/metabolite transporter (DMT)-like permease